MNDYTLKRARSYEKEKDGCFSGSATELPDGRQLLIYTGVRAEESDRQIFQTQCLALGDGKDFQKYEKNPVIGGDMVPAGDSLADFRDPKIWREADGSYRCIAANRMADENGQILMFGSEDALSWRFLGTLLKSDGHFGKMWECPDFFALDGEHVLLISPQDMLPEGLEYHNGDGTVCLIGEYDSSAVRFMPRHHQAIDYGIDFYAPQTVLTEDGRRVMIGWMQNWDARAIREPASPWAGQMSIPRELSIREGRLCQRPIREFDALRRDPVEYLDVPVEGEITLPGIEGRVVDLNLRIRPENPEEGYRRFEICFAEGGGFFTSLRYRPHEQTLKINREFSGSRRTIVHECQCLVEGDGAELNLRIILDRFSVEVFVDDGRKTMTATMYTELSADGISFRCEGRARMDVKQYQIEIG